MVILAGVINSAASEAASGSGPELLSHVVGSGALRRSINTVKNGSFGPEPTIGLQAIRVKIMRAQREKRKRLSAKEG